MKQEDKYVKYMLFYPFPPSFFMILLFLYIINEVEFIGLDSNFYIHDGNHLSYIFSFLGFLKTSKHALQRFFIIPLNWWFPPNLLPLCNEIV